jgi:hypothetical protein
MAVTEEALTETFRKVCQELTDLVQHQSDQLEMLANILATHDKDITRLAEAGQGLLDRQDILHRNTSAIDKNIRLVADKMNDMIKEYNGLKNYVCEKIANPNEVVTKH